MSVPIVICRFRKALTDKTEFDTLARDMAYNFNQPAHTIMPCTHTPPCQPLSKEEESDIKKRIFIEIDKMKKNPNFKHIF
jgi:hypothetical protein